MCESLRIILKLRLGDHVVEKIILFAEEYCVAAMTCMILHDRDNTIFLSKRNDMCEQIVEQ